VIALHDTRDLPDTVAVELRVPTLVQEIASVLWRVLGSDRDYVADCQPICMYFACYER
jgi:hypothetical protein